METVGGIDASAGREYRVWRVPDWFLTVLLAAMPVRWLLGIAVRRLRPKTKKGRCPACGYDLRATPGRCPECGTAAGGEAAAAEPAPAEPVAPRPPAR
jgi:hypothetical protein